MEKLRTRTCLEGAVQNAQPKDNVVGGIRSISDYDFGSAKLEVDEFDLVVPNGLDGLAGVALP